MPASRPDLTILVWGVDPKLGRVWGHKTISDGSGTKKQVSYLREDHEGEGEFVARVEAALAGRDAFEAVGGPRE